MLDTLSGPVRRLANSKRLREIRERAARQKWRIEQLKARSSSETVNSDDVIWMFGTSRTGSTWLADMMGELSGQTVWREPLVGALFGNFYYGRAGHRAEDQGKHFILGEAYKQIWFGPVRDLVLGGAAARFPGLLKGGYLVIKEPNGSIGAPILMEALPESRMIFLVRDPRDVVASSMEARSEGGWQYESRNKGKRRGNLPDRNPNAYVRKRANAYLQQVGNAKRAYDSHRGYKALVRYEDLRANTFESMQQMYEALGIPVDERELARSVERHSWENIPESKKGEGKFYRKASPGGWQEDLTEQQAQIVEQITAPLLKELYPS